MGRREPVPKIGLDTARSPRIRKDQTSWELAGSRVNSFFDVTERSRTREKGKKGKKKILSTKTALFLLDSPSVISQNISLLIFVVVISPTTFPHRQSAF